MRVAAAALFVAGLGLVLAAAGLVVHPYGGLPSTFAAVLVAVGMVCWVAAGGVALAATGVDRQREGNHRAD